MDYITSAKTFYITQQPLPRVAFSPIAPTMVSSLWQPPPYTVILLTGLRIEELKIGDGPVAGRGARVTIRHTAFLNRGAPFQTDPSLRRDLLEAAGNEEGKCLGLSRHSFCHDLPFNF
jgi:hypothetical protein